MTHPAPGLVRCKNCIHGSDLSGTWCTHGERIQRGRTLLFCPAFEDRSLPRPAKPMRCAVCMRVEPWLPTVSGVPMHPDCAETPVAGAIAADAEEQLRKRRQQRELARARAGIQAQAAGMVRCTDCTHQRGRGLWCAQGRVHATGHWRKCEHWTDQPEPVTSPPAAPLPDPAEILEALKAHPAVAFAELTPTGIMLRLHKHATEHQRAEVAAIVGGRAEG